MTELIPVISIHPSKINLYYERYHGERKKIYNTDSGEQSEMQDVNSKFLNSVRKANGILSQNAKRKMSRSIEYLVMMATPKKVHEKLTGKIVSFRVAFLTLTLPSTQIHSDSKIINKCLNQFIIECKKYHGLRNYVWRAEKQKNGNIHFHILLDRFIPWWEARNRWNRILNKLGYVDRFQEKHGHSTPNSTDIHSTRKIKNIRLYLLKYMAKNENQHPQTGRIWSCNQELSNISGCQLHIDTEVQKEMEKLQKELKPFIFQGDYFQVFNITVNDLFKHSRNILFKYFCDYLIEKFGYHPQLKLV